MSEPVSLLKELRSGGYEASLITTFNAYLPFYEDVVLRHLMGSGVRHNVLMMDAAQATLAVDQHPPRSAGRLYTLVPIKVSGAFHPKIILLVGKKKGILFVGSHNLTLSGFGYNREMTNLIHYSGSEDIAAAALFKSVWQGILSWAEVQTEPLHDHLIDMIKKVRDFAPWLQGSAGEESTECRVLSSRPGAPSLWQQLIEFVGTGETNKQVVINGAFFDSNLSFVEKVRSDLSPEEMIVGIDPKTVQFPVDTKLPEASFVNCHALGLSEGYLHAKSILIQRGNGEMVLAVGSANPSFPAWLAPGITQNVEMMIARRGEDAKKTAEELGLTGIQALPPLTADDWESAKQNWEREMEHEKEGSAAHVVIALEIDNKIRFRVPGNALPRALDCEITMAGSTHPITRQAHLDEREYVLSPDGINASIAYFRFAINGNRFTGLVQCVRQIEGLSRTGSQRKLNEALASLTTGMPNLDYFVECIKDIIKISDKVAVSKINQEVASQKKREEEPKKEQEGAELSISLEEVEKQAPQKKQRLRGSDDLGYLLDVLLYNLRDETQINLDAALEQRDALGRSEEEQVEADDEDEVGQPLPEAPDKKAPTTTATSTSNQHDRSPLDICHHKVGSLVSMACDKLVALKEGKLEFEQLVVIMAGILSALRLLRGLDNKVPWIGAGQTAVPKQELGKMFHKIAEVLYDGGRSIINLDIKYAHLAEADELARLKGLVIWLAWESGIALAKQKPFNESSEEREARFETNRLYVATAQLIAGDEDVISEARQSIGLFSTLDMDWFKKILAVDKLLRGAWLDPGSLPTGDKAKTGDFGFNSCNSGTGVREIIAKDSKNKALAWHNSKFGRYNFPTDLIRMIEFERIFDV
ncbi:MAG: hypothetical protein ACYC9M_07525 [Desulfobulbaceae bacterium]